MVDCTLREEKTSVDCKNFTTYSIPGCGPNCWKLIWLHCSILTSFLILFSLCKRFVPEIRPEKNTKVLKILLRKPYFWSLSFLLVLIIVYNTLIIYKNEASSAYIEILVIISKIFTVFLIFQLNFTFPPTVNKGFKLITVACYYCALSLFVLDNLCKFITTSAQVAFKVYTVDKTSAVHAITIVDLMLMVCNAALYSSFLQFFWHKIFRGQKDILAIYRGDLSDSIDSRVFDEEGEQE
jgi:hypothetical protein